MARDARDADAADARARDAPVTSTRDDVAADVDALDAIVRALTRRTTRANEARADADDVRAFKAIVEKYRARPTVLDRALARVIEPLAATVARAARGDEDANARACCGALDALSSVRGWKTCVRFYPNAAKY